MKKISTLIIINYINNVAYPTDEIAHKNQWVIDDKENVIATQKFDGIACAIINGELYKRQDVRKGKKIPENSIPCQDKPDETTGHFPHWVKCDKNLKSDKLFFEGFDNLVNKQDGTYELCGEQISTERFVQNYNVEKIIGHKLIKHGSVELKIDDWSINGFKEFLSKKENDLEGIVFHHKDGRMCKLRKKDFGF